MKRNYNLSYYHWYCIIISVPVAFHLKCLIILKKQNDYEIINSFESYQQFALKTSIAIYFFTKNYSAKLNSQKKNVSIYILIFFTRKRFDFVHSERFYFQFINGN